MKRSQQTRSRAKKVARRNIEEMKWYGVCHTVYPFLVGGIDRN